MDSQPTKPRPPQLFASRGATLGSVARVSLLLVGLGLGFSSCFAGTDYQKVGTVGCDAPTPGSCGEGSAVKMGGSGAVVVTDMAEVEGNASFVVVGRFSGTCTVAGQQLSAPAGETNGFLVELTTSGSYLAHMILPEVDETSDLRVAVDQATTDVVVAGTYSAGPVGSCVAQRGLFARRMSYDNTNGYQSTFGQDVVCVGGGGSAEIRVNSVATYPGYAGLSLGGSYKGTLGGVTSNGIDGFAVSFDPTGVPETPFVLTGPGDAVVQSVMPSNTHNEFVMVGDFSGAITATADDMTINATAVGTRDLFVAAYDTLPGAANLDFTQLGSVGSDHRAVDLVWSPTDTTSATLLASLNGAIDVGTQTLNQAGGQAALALRFQVPVDGSGIPFALQGHHLLRADILEPLKIAGSPTLFVVAGHAVGTVRVEHNGFDIGPVALAGCQKDAFLVRLEGDALTGAQRCGDGTQQVSAMSRRMGGGVIAVTVPEGSSLNAGNGDETVASGTDTVLLLQ